MVTVEHGQLRQGLIAGRGKESEAGTDLARQVRDALARLYDLPYLQGHSLVERLYGQSSDQQRAEAASGYLNGGKRLQRRLLDAIETLRPDPPSGRAEVSRAAPVTQARRHYEVLTLRYVEALRPTDVQRRLAISRSEYFRRHQQALEALVALLDQLPPTLQQIGLLPVATAAPSHTTSTIRPTTSLPSSLTSFVGRERELAEVRQRLAKTRLLTLVGLGGIGKTRLALQTAASALEDYPDGVWLVELASLADPALVSRAVAQATGVHAQAGRPLLEEIASALRGKRALVVLDNCEHLIETCAEVAATLLRCCPGVQILTTSREVLGIAGEALWRVPPLALPENANVPHGANAASCESVRLFLDRAQAVQPQFALTPENASSIVQICRHLDGIPLAIELAAARMRALSVEQLLGRLEDRFSLLTSGNRAAAPHQRALRATIDWSYDLLSPPEKTLFNRLAVFAGGFTVESIEAVCGDDNERMTKEEGPMLPPSFVLRESDVLALLLQLVDKSLVVAEPPSSGAVRYRLLETLRQYAEERLVESGEADEIRRRHAHYFLSLAEEGAPRITGSQRLPWVKRVCPERENLHAALLWAVQRQEIALSLRLAITMRPIWHNEALFHHGRDWCLRVVALAESDSATEKELLTLRAQVLLDAGRLALMANDADTRRNVCEQALAIASSLGDQQLEGQALDGLALVLSWKGERAAARRMLYDYLAIAQELEDTDTIARAHTLLGFVSFTLDDFDAATEHAHAAARMQRALGVGQLETSLHTLGRVAQARGDLATARQYFGEARAVNERMGNRNGLGCSLFHLGDVALDEGDIDEAGPLLTESLRLHAQADQRLHLARTLDALAGLAVALNQPERALCLASAATAMIDAVGSSREPLWQAKLARRLAVAREAIGDDLARAAEAEGQTLSPMEAVAEALSVLEYMLPHRDGAAIQIGPPVPAP